MRIIFSLLFISTLCFAQFQNGFFPGGSYLPSIPAPREVLGYEIGERFTDFRNLERYIEQLVSASDRLIRVVYGESYERRPLQAFIVSSPANLARLEQIKAANRSLTDPRTLQSPQEADRVIATLPVIVFLSYSVHGNESSSTEAAIQMLYQLCAGTDERTRAILENAIVIVDPVVNPDGRERYVQWANSTLGSRPNPNVAAVEHSEPWPGGRTNHYYFDLNRDWSWQTQKESIARVAFYREWMPHVHVDYHEMGHASTYFFFPAAVPVHETLPPEVLKWGKIFGRANADAFDQLGIPYFVGEYFDMFYPGYGDSWPTFNGAIGMTYEQAGGGRAGLAVLKPDGKLLTLRDRAFNHFTTGIATLETSIRHRKERIADFHQFWRTGLKLSGKMRGFVIAEDGDPNRAARLVATLLRQGIEVHRLDQPAQLQVQRFYSTRPARMTLPVGSYYVPLDQPHSRLLRALLEPVAMARDTFFYDVSAWSLPVAYGLPAFSTESPLPQSATKLVEPPRTDGRIIGGKASFAYLIPWERNDAVRLAWHLLEKGYRLSVARRGFETEGRAFGPGTIIALAAAYGDSLHSDLAHAAERFGVEIYAAHSGLTEKGISLGSNHVVPVRRPEVALVTGSPVSASSYGELWYLFDQELQVASTSIRAADLGDIDLSQFSVIILPNGSAYQTVLDSSKIDRLRRWVQDGGVLIGLEGGARFLTKGKSGLTSAILTSDKKEEDKSSEEKKRDEERKEAAKRMTQFEKDELVRLERIPGTIFRVLVDSTHPVGFGFGREVYALKGDGDPIELSDRGHTVARFAADSVQASGYVTAEKAKRVADSAFILDFGVGKGRVVLFSESVTFRMFWKGIEKLLLNAVLFLPRPQ